MIHTIDQNKLDELLGCSSAIKCKNPYLPAITPVSLSTEKIFCGLQRVDNDSAMRKRVLKMEDRFQQRINAYLNSKSRSVEPVINPFALMVHSYQQGYHHVAEAIRDIPAASSLASIETETGRMIDAITFDAYGWTIVKSAMHSKNTVIDGWKIESDKLKCATLKSGPRCINDAMSKDIASDVSEHIVGWAEDNQVDKIEFSYATIYGTPLKSNKKDWHILRRIRESLSSDANILNSHKKSWLLSYEHNDIAIDINIRHGLNWWRYIGGDDAWIELIVAFIRATIRPTSNVQVNELIPPDYNVALLQRSQLEWLLMAANNLCDIITSPAKLVS